jgi:hypothetical protein|tara:strand:+ start:5561 stop:6124 length:564 start_codon:yes stop_codon:yes gene_type:complete
VDKYWREIIEIKYIADGPTPRSYWVIPDLLAAGAYPGKQGSGTKNVIPEVLEQLLESGINTFINLTEDLGGGDKLELYDPFLPSSCIVDRFPVKDVNIPTPEFMVKILNAIDTYLEGGHVPYIHCWGGIGRTGTAVGCWLIRHGHATPATVIDLLDELRLGDIEAGYRPSPETGDQLDFILDWELGK